MEDKLQAFKLRAKELLEDNPEVIQVYLIKSKISEDWGLFYIENSDAQSNIENHCQQCFEEWYPLRFGMDKDFPHMQLSLVASPNKFEAMKLGKIKFLDTLELCELLESR